MAAFIANGKPSDGVPQKTDSEGHVLVALWKEYEEVKKSDRPQKQTEILENIMSQSIKQSLYWDYNCASTEWYRVVTSRNWKLQDSSKTRILEDIAAMDCPILTYTIKNYFSELDNAEEFVSQIQTRAEELRKSVNRGFYNALKGSAPDFIVDGISNDYEYLLWTIGIYYRYSRVNEETAKTAADLLDAELGGKYPAAAFIEFLNILRDNPYDNEPVIVPLESDEPSVVPLSADGGDATENSNSRKKALEAFSQKYSGKAIAVLSDQQLLVDKLHNMERNDSDEDDDEEWSEENEAKKPSSEEYKVIRAELEALKLRRDAFVRDEAKVAAAAEEIDRVIEYLDAKRIAISAKDGIISVYMQNVDSVRLYLYKGKEELLSTVLKNPVCSYFRIDTVKYNFPDCPDGEYVVKCVSGKMEKEFRYNMRSISIAHREIDTGEGIYIADYKTGRPIQFADLLIYNGHNRYELISEIKDFEFNGFTSIQNILESLATDKRQRFTVKCSYIDDGGWRRVSDDLSFWVARGGTAKPVVAEPSLTATIFKDRSAFNPGDSVQFKVLAYYRQGEELSVATNTQLQVKLFDPDRKAVATEDFITNEFGSLAGSFALGKESKGGTYNIYVYSGDNSLASSQLTVDEFVLPAYDLEFDKDDTPYFSGDTVSVRGRLFSYSGHSLSSVKVAYEISYYSIDGEKTLTGSVFADYSGRFNIQFVADKKDNFYWEDDCINYYLTVRATALDGETWEWSKNVIVNPDSSMYINFYDMAEGRAEADGKGISAILSSSDARLCFPIYISGLEIQPEIPVRYKVSCNGESVLSGTAVSGEDVTISFDSLPSGIYNISAEGEYVSPTSHRIEFSAEKSLLKVSDDDKSIVEGLDYFYKKLDNGRIAAQFGTSEPERWFVVEVYGCGRELLHSEIVCLGTDSESARTLDYEYDKSYPDAVRLSIFSFKDSDSRLYSFLYERPVEVEAAFPLSFSSFTDKSQPHSECVMTLQTGTDSEAVVSVFDKSSETIRSNVWSAVRTYSSSSFHIGIDWNCGYREGGYGPSQPYYGGSSRYWSEDGYADSFSNMYFEAPGARILYSESEVYSRDESVSYDEYSAVYEEEADMVYESSGKKADIDTSDVQVRDGMDHSSVFLPFLRSDSDGKIEFSFTTSDRASAYIVSVFAHDRNMRNAVLRREMVVSLPLELSVAQPQFLYEGDIYMLRASVSNSEDRVFEGNMVLEVYDTEEYNDAEPVAKYSRPLTVGAEDAAMAEFEIVVPRGVSVLGLKVAYIGTEMDETSVTLDSENSSSDSAAATNVFPAARSTVSDAMFVSIPVKVPTQTITEAHSAVISGDADIEAAKAALAAEFTGIDASDAEYKEISLIDMITEAIPAEIKAGGKDVLSRSRTFYAGRMAEYLARRAGVKIPVTDDPSELIDKMLACQNSDGGFGWFENFNSSPILTALILERFAALAERGLIDAEISAKISSALVAAVKYLDNKQFEYYLYWGGSLSLTQYLCVRTMYPDVEFSPLILNVVPVDAKGSNSSSKATSTDKKREAANSKKTLAEFKKDVKKYLLPKDKTALNGYIIDKARRVMISSVLSSDAGAALAKAWGLSESSVKKIAKSVDTDMLSLSEYAVEHRSGGVYYPNAVLPFRGLLESEAYAHAHLCDLMEKYYSDGNGAEYHRIAEGIRLWLMIQKETQQWNDDPAFLDAICMVLDGSDETLNTRIAVLTKEYSKPLGEIVAAGNGLTVERTFYRILADSDSSAVNSSSSDSSGTAEYDNSSSDSGESDGISSSNSSEGRGQDSSAAVLEGGVQGISSATKLKRVALKEGDVLNVGDKIIAEYRVWNEENRSFVKLETPRYAALRPVEQLSGRVGGLLRTITTVSFGYFYPSAYREVKADKTILYFDVLPEENSIFTEEFYVTQAGTFVSPVITVESTYAPHYRANGNAELSITVE